MYGKSISLLLLLLVTVVLSGCLVVKYHNYADTNKEVAMAAIKRLKNDTLIVVLPTFQSKERILQNASRSRKKRKTYKPRLIELYAERQLLQEAIIQSFDEHFTFCPVLYIPDSLVYDLESGKQKGFFLDKKAKIDPSIIYSNRKPIKLVQQFDQEWQIKIGNAMIPNPFPNYYLYRNGLYGFLGEEAYDQMYKRVAEVFQKRFEQFYDDPESRIYL